MKKAANIIELYFIQMKSIKEIASIVNTSTSYVSRILKQDKRYITEKKNRADERFKQRREKQKEQIYSKRVNKSINQYNSMQLLQQLHNQDVLELSEHRNIGNQALRKWCSSAYKFNSDKNRYEFNTERLTKPMDFPLYIKA